MKKLLITVLSAGIVLLMATAAFAADASTFVCPNGNEACTANGACINNGVCQSKERCPNGGVPKRDGTGHRGGGQGRGHHGGHHGR